MIHLQCSSEPSVCVALAIDRSLLLFLSMTLWVCCQSLAHLTLRVAATRVLSWWTRAVARCFTGCRSREAPEVEPSVVASSVVAPSGAALYIRAVSGVRDAAGAAHGGDVVDDAVMEDASEGVPCSVSDSDSGSESCAVLLPAAAAVLAAMVPAVSQSAVSQPAVSQPAVS